VTPYGKEFCCAYAARHKLPPDRCPFRQQPDHARSPLARLKEMLAKPRRGGS